VFQQIGIQFAITATFANFIQSSKWVHKELLIQSWCCYSWCKNL